MTRKMKLKTNMIHAGHNIYILTNQFPDESVDLIYLDPPFFSGSNYDIVWGNGTEMQAYEDAGMYWRQRQVDEETLKAEFRRHLKTLPDSIVLNETQKQEKMDNLRREMQGRISKGEIDAYLHYMAPILRELHRVLKLTGSIYLHCDHHANAHLRILMDGIFGQKNFRNEIIWCYAGGGIPKKDFPRKHDTIFRYSKSNDYQYNPEYRPYGDWVKASKSAARHSLTGGGKPLDLKKGTPINDWWSDLKNLTSYQNEWLGYQTQKPEALLERIILASSKKGDIILDPFLGGGTTCVVAHRLGRKYIGIDISPRACAMTVRNFERYGVEIDYKKQLNFDYPKVITTMELMSKLGKFLYDKYEAWVRNALGFKDKKLSHRMGIDGIKYRSRKVAGKRVYDEFLEVKKWKAKVGRRVVNTLAGNMLAFGVRKGVIVANQFTRDARKRVDVLTKEGVHIRLRMIDSVIEQNEELMRDPTLIDFTIEEADD